MKFTTHFEQESQPTRLWESLSYAEKLRVKDGILTLSDPLFQKSYTRVDRWQDFYRLQLKYPFGHPIFTLSSSRFTRRY